LLLSTILGMTIYSKNMVKIGRIKDLEVDDEMKTTFVVIDLERNATKKIFDKMIAMRHGKGKIPPTLIEKIGKDAVILKQTITELKASIESI
jgi:sporulation protein YlmC with PRC-barrel domain